MRRHTVLEYSVFLSGVDNLVNQLYIKNAYLKAFFKKQIDDLFDKVDGFVYR